MKKKLFVIGIDVSKDKLDVCFHDTGFHFIIENGYKGFAKLVEFIIKDVKCSMNDVFICFENTGKYSKQLSVFLSEQNIKFNMSPALAIKRSLGIVRGKDDKIDAKRIAQYAYEKYESINTTILPGYKIDQIKSLISLREKLIKHRTAYKNGISGLKDCYLDGENDLIKNIQEKLIEELTQKIDLIEAEIESIIKNDPVMNKNYNLIMSIKGVGKITSFYFIALTANFTLFCNAKSFACYCGIAPFPYSSGLMVGRSRIHGFANKKMKAILDMAAKSAIQYNKELKSYYDRRIFQMGKSKMSTINIIRNKIVSRVFAVINRGTPYVDLHKFAV